MEEEIQEKLEEIYKDIVDVKFRGTGIYDVFLKIKGEKLIGVAFYYQGSISMNANIRNVCCKLDNEIVKLFKKEVRNE